MEVYPAARKGGRGIVGEEKEKRGLEEEEEEVEGGSGWLAGRQRNLQSNPELCRIDQGAEVLLDTAIKGRGGV